MRPTPHPPLDDDTLTSSRSAARGDARVAALLLVHHPDPSLPGLYRSFEPGEQLRIGRGRPELGPGVQDDPRLSRDHADLHCEEGGILLRDLGSHNGSWVNGQRATEQLLLPGDVLVMGDTIWVHRPVPRGFTPRRASGEILSTSPAMDAVLAEVDRAAPGPSAVLLLGETGTGKELLARRLHNQSQRKGPFVALNCGALDDNLLQSELFGHIRGAFSGATRDRVGLAEEAHGGTLFLDEIGEASPGMQSSLLRLLQEGEMRRVGSNQPIRVDVRFVAATLQPLREQAAAGSFRSDLLARLSRWVVDIPPLRERREDVLPIARAVAARLARSPLPFRRRLAEALLNHPWRHNVREVEAVIERLFVGQRGEAALDLKDGVLEPEPAPPVARSPSAVPLPDEPEEQTVRPRPAELRRRLLQHRGNVKALAIELGIGRNTLYRWMKQAGIDLNALRGAPGSEGEPGEAPP